MIKPEEPPKSESMEIVETLFDNPGVWFRLPDKETSSMNPHHVVYVNWRNKLRYHLPRFDRKGEFKPSLRVEVEGKNKRTYLVKAWARLVEVDDDG